MSEVEIVLALLVAVAALAALAAQFRAPYPILLVMGGVVLGFVPALPPIQLDPETVFLIFVPPLVFAAAFFTSWRDFTADARPILLLAVGLVLATTFVVAGMALRCRDGRGPAFVPGSRRLQYRHDGGGGDRAAGGVAAADHDDPGRESLVNDAVGLDRVSHRRDRQLSAAPSLPGTSVGSSPSPCSAPCRSGSAWAGSPPRLRAHAHDAIRISWSSSACSRRMPRFSRRSDRGLRHPGGGHHRALYVGRRENR